MHQPYFPGNHPPSYLELGASNQRSNVFLNALAQKQMQAAFIHDLNPGCQFYFYRNKRYFKYASIDKVISSSE